MPDFKAIGRHTVALSGPRTRTDRPGQKPLVGGFVGPKDAGPGAAGGLPAGRQAPRPRRCVSSRWILFVRCVGWTRGMVLKPGCASKHVRGLPKAQVPGPPSRRGWVGIWAFHTFPGAAVKPAWHGRALQGKLLANHGGVSACTRGRSEPRTYFPPHGRISHPPLPAVGSESGFLYPRWR